MRRTIRTLLAAAGLVLALGGATAAHAAPLAGLDVDLAVAQPDATTDSSLDHAQALHVQVVRVGIDWASLEPLATGQQDPAYLAVVDHMVAAAHARGLRVLLLVQGSPCWASTGPSDVIAACGQPGFRGQAAEAYPPKDPSTYGEVVGFLAGRYAADLAAIELWNEPDHASEDYFKGPDKPRHYVELVKAAYPRAKAAAPHVPVLAGSLVGADGRFLKALYAQGMRGYYDGLAVHYYDLVLASLRSIRAVQKAAGDTKPLWLDEFGWTSCYPGRTTQSGHACVTRAVQASNLTDTFRALRDTSWVKAAVVYNMEDSTQYDFGLLDAHGNPKPAFPALAALLGASRIPAPAAPRLRLARRGGAVVASGSGPAADDYELDVSVGGRLRYKAVLRLSRDKTFSVRIPAQLGTRGLTVRVFQYWTERSATARI